MRPTTLLHFIHTPDFDDSLSEIPLGDEELASVQQELQSDPESGSIITGTGGVRKLRTRAKGRGKSGGARVLYYYAPVRCTIYLLLAYSKSEADSVSAAGKQLLKKLAVRLDREGQP